LIKLVNSFQLSKSFRSESLSPSKLLLTKQGDKLQNFNSTADFVKAACDSDSNSDSVSSENEK
jgi:hypothetical protein